MQVEVVWQDDDGSLAGWVEVTNDGPEVLRVGGKPSVTPLAVGGSRLDLPHAVTLEMLVPGYVDVPPGGRARAPISWGAWDGPEPSGDVVVSWGPYEGPVEVTVPAIGPRQPGRTSGGVNTSSSWFVLLA